MPTLLETLRSNLPERHQELTELFDLGMARSGEQDKRLNELVIEVETLNGQIDAETAREEQIRLALESSGKRLARLGELQNLPPFPGSGSALNSSRRKPNLGRFVGWTGEESEGVTAHLGRDPGRDGANGDDWRDIALDDPDRAVKLMTGDLYDVLDSRDYHRGFREFLRLGKRGVTDNDLHRLGLEAGMDGSGGVLVPTEILRRIVQRKGAPTRVAGACNRLPTNAPDVFIPFVNDYGGDSRYSSAARVTWTAEESDAVEHRQPMGKSTFGSLKIDIHQGMMSLPLTVVLAEDSTYDVLGWLANEFYKTREKVYDDFVLNGPGTGQPKGILTSTGTNPQTQVPLVPIGTTITADGLLDLTNSIEEEDEQNLRLFMRRTTTWKNVRKLKDQNNRYLIGFGESDNGLSTAPARVVDGHPVSFSAFMPPAGTGNKSVLFGNLQGYTIVERVGYSVQILREVGAKNGIIEILARFRVGGRVVEPWLMRVGIQTAV